jgi:hypothetical protein
MLTSRSKTLRWTLAVALLTASLYCLLAVLQAGSIYTGQRAAFNLNFWGSLGLTFLAVSYITIPRQGFARPSFWNQWLALFVWACTAVAAIWQLVEFAFANLACQTAGQAYDALTQQCHVSDVGAASLFQSQGLFVVALAIAAGLLWRSLVRRRTSAMNTSAA